MNAWDIFKRTAYLETQHLAFGRFLVIVLGRCLRRDLDSIGFMDIVGPTQCITSAD